MTLSDRHIVIVEDDTGVRDGLVAVLESWGFRATAFPTAESLLSGGTPRDAVCLLLDVRLPGIDGVELVARLRRAGDMTPILMMSGHGDISTAVAAMRAGAQDFLEKPFDDGTLVERLNRAADVSLALPPAEEAKALIAGLTPRENDVMREVVAGHPNKVVAHRLGIGLKTVEMHRARVMKKTGSKTLAHLVRIAAAAGYGR